MTSRRSLISNVTALVGCRRLGGVTTKLISLFPLVGTVDLLHILNFQSMYIAAAINGLIHKDSAACCPG